jgi:hypothetical protein
VNKELVFEIESYYITARQATEKFAEEYFDKPRKILFEPGGTFTLIDGVAKYLVYSKIGIPYKTPSTYQIFRFSK